jgi:hypothetical protein
LFTAELDEMSIISTTKHQKSNGMPPISADTRNRSQTRRMSGESNYTKRYYDKDVTLSSGGIACPNHLIQTLEKMRVLFSIWYI